MFLPKTSRWYMFMHKVGAVILANPMLSTYHKAELQFILSRTDDSQTELESCIDFLCDCSVPFIDCTNPSACMSESANKTVPLNLGQEIAERLEGWLRGTWSLELWEVGEPTYHARPEILPIDSDFSLLTIVKTPRALCSRPTWHAKIRTTVQMLELSKNSRYR